MFTSLILGASHTGKTQSLGTLQGKTVLFNFDGPDNVTSIRVPFKEVLRLEDYWLDPFDFGRVLVVNYTAVGSEVDLQANPKPSKEKIEYLIKDINSLRANLGELATEEGPGNLVVETLGTFADPVLDYIVASNGRADAQIQDYRPAMRKVAAILGSLMGFGLNVVLTGHLQSDRDEITQRGRLIPLVWGKMLPDAIPRMFGEIFQSTVVSEGGVLKYKWLTKPDPGGFIEFLGTRKMDAEKLPRYIPQDFGYLEKALKEAGKK